MADLMLFSPNLQTLVLVVDFLKSFRASTLGGNIQDEIAIFTRKRSSAPACSSKQLNRDVHSRCVDTEMVLCPFFHSLIPD